MLGSFNFLKRCRFIGGWMGVSIGEMEGSSSIPEWLSCNYSIVTMENHVALSANTFKAAVLDCLTSSSK